MDRVQVGICTSLKDEGHSLRPWLEFHALVGVSKFFLLNDGSSDTTAAILSEYAAKGLVTELQPWSDSERSMDAIVRILRRCYDVVMPELDWMLVIDGDEYVFPIGPECSLPAYVRNNCPRRQTHTYCVGPSLEAMGTSCDRRRHRSRASSGQVVTARLRRSMARARPVARSTLQITATSADTRSCC